MDWLSTFVLFAGTLVFGLLLLDSFLDGLSGQQVNRLIRAPDMVGCVLVLISGHLFTVSALAAFTRPAIDSLVDTAIANWGTLAGALCFSLAGFLQLDEHP